MPAGLGSEASPAGRDHYLRELQTKLDQCSEQRIARYGVLTVDLFRPRHNLPGAGYFGLTLTRPYAKRSRLTILTLG